MPEGEGDSVPLRPWSETAVFSGSPSSRLLAILIPKKAHTLLQSMSRAPCPWLLLRPGRNPGTPGPALPACLGGLPQKLPAALQKHSPCPLRPPLPGGCVVGRSLALLPAGPLQFLGLLLPLAASSPLPINCCAWQGAL